MSESSGPSPEIGKRLEACRLAAKTLRSAETSRKNAVLLKAADLLIERKARLLSANSQDLAALPGTATPAFRDRLSLNGDRIGRMAESLRQVAALPDPVGEEVGEETLANGLVARKVRSPLGVILMIFESRPNVAVEAFSLAFKSGNVILLRGGKESMSSTAAIYELLADALRSQSMPEACLWGITDPDRALTLSLLQQRKWIDIVVPRGGDGLIEFVSRNTSIPIIKNDRGLCHVYVHEDADLDQAVEIVANAKCQRPGVCNAMETLLVHRKVHQALLPRIHDRLQASSTEWFGCPETLAVLRGREGVHPARPESYDTEYLDFKLSSRIVGSLDEAIEHIERHGSRHSEAILTRSEAVARRFQTEVDAAAVYWNASTRFTDGFELGLGGELGISTQKLHVRGPVGLRELTSVRWIIEGQGQVRGG